MASTVIIEGVPDTDGHNSARRFGTVSVGEYATTGIAVTAAQLGFATLDDLDISASAGYVPEWVKSTGKVKVYWVDTSVDGAAMAEVTNATDLALVNFRFRARGQ